MDSSFQKTEFDELFERCQHLENTIQMLLRSNALKKANINKLRAEIIQSYGDQQKNLAEMEQKYQADLAAVKVKSEKLELELRQVNIINDELSEVVNRAQQASHAGPDASKKTSEAYYFMSTVIERLDHIRNLYNSVFDGIRDLEATSPKDSYESKEVLEESRNLTIEVEKNRDLIRLLEKQGKFAEQQFDLILNQIPWEPLTTSYIKELRGSTNEDVRNMADVLALQVSEIQDLEESLISKKGKKLELLKNLTDQLDSFVRRRSEAILIESQSANRLSGQ